MGTRGKSVSVEVEDERAAAAVIEAAAARRGPALLTCWLGETSAAPTRAALQAAGMPTFATPEQAVRAFIEAARHREIRAALSSEAAEATLASATAGPPAAPEAVLASAAAREWLTQSEARAVLGAYGIPTSLIVEASTPEEAAEAAAELGGSVALKIASPDIVHKSEVGGVVLNLVGAAAVASAATAMLRRVVTAAPSASLRGFTVERMFDRGRGLELIVGAKAGGDFGPVVLFGEGGTAVEAIADTALDLPPLDLELARRMIGRTRVYRRMTGYRDVPPVDVDAVARVIVAVARIVADFPCVAEIDVNPLLATADGCIALDSRLRLAARTAHGAGSRPAASSELRGPQDG
jgi:acetyltransferase